jgi:crotonobetainyl-CoA:carnitine CoA-transferase CaiB-like acyl-CoA transferase
VLARETLLPQVRALFKRFDKAELVARLERTGLPFAPIGKPEDMFEDPHLLASGGLAEVTLVDGTRTRLPLLPIEVDGIRPTQGGDLPRPGEHTNELLARIGLSAEDVARLRGARIVE